MRQLARKLIRTPMSRRIGSLLRSIVLRIEAANAVPAQVESPPGISSIPVLPEWVRAEIAGLAVIEPELAAARDDPARFAFYAIPSHPEPGRVYSKLLAHLSADSVSHVLLVPWLKQGGADRGIIYHAKAIAEAVPGARVLVIATENSDSPWSDRLPEGIQFLEFGQISATLSFGDQVTVLARLLVQYQPRMIHVVNSRVGWEVLRKYALQLRQHGTLFASLFCDDYDEHMVPVGYARDYLRDCHDQVSTVFCDNSRYPHIWEAELGVPAASCTVLPFPYDGDVSVVPATAVSQDGASNVLWAGRLDRQKRPDILLAIAERMPDMHFDVFGKVVMGTDLTDIVQRLGSQANVTLHGEFQRLEAVVDGSHFAYLHTTGWEGTPTILFDVAAAGLPICAPAVGGIVDFIQAEMLVPKADDLDGFVERLRLLQTSSHERNLAVMQQRETLLRQRSWESFHACLAAIPGYFECVTENAQP